MHAHCFMLCYMGQPSKQFLLRIQKVNFRILKTKFHPSNKKKAYKLYFGCKVGDHDKTWALYTYCIMCLRLATGWLNAFCQILFAIFMVQRQAT